MKPFERRVWLTAITLILCYLGTRWVCAGYSFEVIPLSRDLSLIPLEFAEWRGKDIPMDERILKVLNAQQTLNRSYQRPDGTHVELNISAWLNPETVSSVAPHVPKLCYMNAGWAILKESHVLASTPGVDVPLTILLCERKGDRIVVAYFYRMGDAYFNSANEARNVHRTLWGQRRWPATVKVLLQTPANSIEAGLPPIKQFVSLLQEQMNVGSDPGDS